MKKTKLFLFDMDGTIFLGDKLIDGSLEFIDHLNDKYIDYVFLTNNSSKNISQYVDKLNTLGIKVHKEQIVTSGTATAKYIKNQNSKATLYVVGTDAFKDELKNYGLKITDNVEDKIDYLVLSYDTELTYQKLTDAVVLLNKGVEFIATNPDLLCPYEDDTYLPDCGLFCYMLEVATNRKPLYIGKPRKEIIETILLDKGYSKDETLIVGDRLYTDIACGINAGVNTALVLSGEAKITDIDKSPYKPTHVFDSIKQLHKNFI